MSKYGAIIECEHDMDVAIKEIVKVALVTKKITVSVACPSKQLANIMFVNLRKALSKTKRSAYKVDVSLDFFPIYEKDNNEF